MKDFLNALSEYDFLLNVISCVFTVLALIFTLYFWLLDHLSEDESKFIEGKGKFLSKINECIHAIDNLTNTRENLEKTLPLIEQVYVQLEVILNYRFWARCKQKDEYKMINTFNEDSKYLISTIRRSLEFSKVPAPMKDSLVSIQPLAPEEIYDIQADYKNGLLFVKDFIENWN